MKIELIRTEEPDGKWYKILGPYNWPLKIIKFDDSNELEKQMEALDALDKIVEDATAKKITIIKSIEI